MRIGLFIPCYIDAFFPKVGIATLELLERFGHEVDYPRDQTCCGQPMANSGFNAECADTEALFVRNFSGFDYVVAPSGSCVHHVRDNFDAIEQTAEVKEVRERTYELVEFLHDILKVDAFPWARFPHRVGLHNSCGTLRRLKHATPSELHEPFSSKPMDLLSKIDGIERDRKSTRLNSSHVEISYAVFCLKKKKKRRGGISRLRTQSEFCDR